MRDAEPAKAAIDGQHPEVVDAFPIDEVLNAKGDDSEAVEQDDWEQLRALGYLASEPIHESTGVVLHDANSAQPGWNLCTQGGHQEAQLLDMDGQTLHVWQGRPKETKPAKRLAMKGQGIVAHKTSMPELPGPSWRTVHMFDNGDLLAQTDDGPIARLDWDSNLLWEYRAKTHHDFDLREDGHIFVITKSRRTHPVFGRIVEDFIVELDPEGVEVHKLSLFTALINGEQKELIRELRNLQGQTKDKTDILHTNSIELLDGSLAAKIPAFKRGNLLISLRMISRVAIVDLDSEKVIWSMNGSFRVQHHATMLENGRLMLFDNRGLSADPLEAPDASARSRILEIDPSTGQDQWAHGAEESEKFFSQCCGRVYRLTNGNTLIVETKTGRAFEIDDKHRLVWEFNGPKTIGIKVANLNDMLRIPVVDSLRDRVTP